MIRSGFRLEMRSVGAGRLPSPWAFLNKDPAVFEGAQQETGGSEKMKTALGGITRYHARTTAE